jgi:hypothetical protein
MSNVVERRALEPLLSFVWCSVPWQRGMDFEAKMRKTLG